jgi:hypothetical protein
VAERHFRRAIAECVTRVSTTRCLRERQPAARLATYLDARDWADCLATTNGPHGHVTHPKRIQDRDEEEYVEGGDASLARVSLGAAAEKRAIHVVGEFAKLEGGGVLA